MTYTLRSKFFLIFTALVLITSILVSFLIGFSLNKVLKDELLSRATVSVSSMASGLSDLVLSGDTGGVVGLIFNEKTSDPSIAYIIVLDANNKVVSSTLIGDNPAELIPKNNFSAEAQESTALITDTKGEQVYDIATRLKYNSGTLRVAYYSKQISAAVWRAIGLVIISSLISLFIALWLAFFFSKAIFKPINILKTTIDKIVSGDLSQRAPIVSQDETGYLAVSFNKLLDNLGSLQEEQLKKEKEHFMDLAENTPLCIKIFNKDGKLTFINKNGRDEHFIKDGDDITKWDWVGTVKPEYQATVKAAFEGALKGKEAEVEMEHTPEGSTHQWCRGIISPIKDTGGNVTSVLFYSVDFSDLRNAEIKTREAQEYAENLLEAANALVVELDLFGNIKSFNKKAEEVTGYSRKELLGKSWFETITPPKKFPEVAAMFKDFQKGGDLATTFENPILTKNGEVKFISWQNSVVARNNITYGTISFGIDITDLKKAQQQIKESEKHYRELIEATPLCVKVFDKDGKLKFINKGGRDEHFIKDGDDITKWDWVGTVKPEYQATVKTAFDGALKGKAAEVEMEHTPEGATHAWCHGVISPIKNGNNEVESVLFYSLDITALKNAERDLVKISWQNKLILESSGDGILGLDTEGRHTFVNPAAAKMLGYGIEEMVGKPSHTMWHYKKEDGSDFPQKDCLIYKALKENVSQEGVGFFWRKDGTGFNAAYKSAPIIEDGQTQGAVVTFSDITEKIKLEKEVARKYKDLEKFQELTVGRELRMVELKKQLKDLEKKLQSNN